MLWRVKLTSFLGLKMSIKFAYEFVTPYKEQTDLIEVVYDGIHRRVIEARYQVNNYAVVGNALARLKYELKDELRNLGWRGFRRSFFPRKRSLCA